MPFFIEIWNLKQDFSRVNFIHISREENEEADRMVNKELIVKWIILLKNNKWELKCQN